MKLKKKECDDYLARLHFLVGIENGRKPSPGTRVVADFAQYKTSFAPPLGLRLQRTFLGVQYSLERRLKLVGGLPASVDFFEKEVVVQLLLDGNVGSREDLAERFADDRFRGAVLRHFQDQVRLLFGPARGDRRSGSNVLNAVDDEEKHAALDGSGRLCVVVAAGGGRDGRRARVFRIRIRRLFSRNGERDAGFAVHHVASFLFERCVDEEGRERERLILSAVQSDVTVARPEIVDGDHSLGRHVVGRHIRHRQPEECQIAKQHRESEFVL